MTKTEIPRIANKDTKKKGELRTTEWWRQSNQPGSGVVDGDANLDALRLFVEPLQTGLLVHQQESGVGSGSGEEQGQEKDGCEEEPGHGRHRVERAPSSKP